MAKCLQWAQWYAKRGFSVIPVGPDKKPLLKWQKYQQERAMPDEIEQWWQKWPDANVGIVTGSISGICVVDIDTEEGREVLEEVLPDSCIPPAAQTPKGGQHLYFLHSEGMRNNSRTLPGCDFRGEGGYVVAPPSINGTGKRYAWLRGLDKYSLPELPESYVKAVTTELKNCYEPIKVVTTVTMFMEGRRDNDLFHVANCLAKGGMPEGEAVQVMQALMASWGECDEKWAKTKVDSAYNRRERRVGSLSDEARQWVLSQDRIFTVKDCYHELQLLQKEDRGATRVAFHRMKEEGLIEPYGDRAGGYRRVSHDCPTLDFMASSPLPFAIEMPFKLSQLVHIYPRNIVVVAGTFDSGKTAFMLEFASEAMKRYKVHYYSSEMAEQELRRRLEKTGIPLEEWQRVDFRERARDFSDVIHPDDVNIIDFMELHEEPYKVGAYIRRIHEKLKSGIAIIGLQKKPGNDVGVGGIGSAEKPRLYITMDRDRKDKRQVIVKIEKAKNWAQTVNPNGLQMIVEVENGCRFRQIRDWYRED